MRARRHERWLEDVDAILLEAELAELHDDVLNTLLLMAETFADQEFYLHAEFVLDHFITFMEEVALQFRWFSFVGATGRSPLPHRQRCPRGIKPPKTERYHGGTKIP